MSKTTKNWKKSDNLENEVKDHEKELEAIKEALEKNNMNAINNLQIKNIPKTNRYSAKVPKRLTEKEKERRDEIRRLKEVEDLNKIQQQLFKQVKSRRKIEPIDKRILTTNNKFINIDKDDIFAMNLNKECDRILGNENSKQSISNKTVTTVWRNNSKNKSNKKIIKNINKNNAYPLSAINRKNSKKKKVDKEEIADKQGKAEKNEKNQKISEKTEKKEKKEKKEKILNDEEKDENFLKTLDDEIKKFYMEKTKEIFDLLKEINLCRYIDCFLREGYDIFEEFIELPNDFFEKMDEPFLTKEQQEKLYNKLSIFKNKNKGDEKLSNKNDKKEPNGISLLSETQPEFNKKNKKSNFLNNLLENINKNILANDNIINDTSPIIKKEELFSTNIDIKELEQQRTEDFKKAVDEWRNNNTNNNLSSIDNLNKINKDTNAPVNDSSLLVNSTDDIICCWNCFKPIKKENSIQKDYDNKFDKSVLFSNKNFCNLKCMKEYEKKKKATYVCFNCNKIFDLYQGFVAHEGEKFCSTKCKEKYIEIEYAIIKNNKKKKDKIVYDEKNEQNKNEILNNNKINDEEYYEGDDYDPMDDF